jgi:hypothetical protein
MFANRAELGVVKQPLSSTGLMKGMLAWQLDLWIAMFVIPLTNYAHFGCLIRHCFVFFCEAAHRQGSYHGSRCYAAHVLKLHQTLPMITRRLAQIAANPFIEEYYQFLKAALKFFNST